MSLIIHIKSIEAPKIKPNLDKFPEKSYRDYFQVKIDMSLMVLESCIFLILLPHNCSELEQKSTEYVSKLYGPPLGTRLPF